MNEWRFKEKKNTAIVTTKNIINHTAWIGYVSHDIDDGSWQFLELNNKELTTKDAAIFSLENIVELDESVNDLADLPLGWTASRSSKSSPWIKKKK